MTPYDWLVRRSRSPDLARHDRLLRIEPLEDRRMLAVIVVMNNLDLGAGSLRQAMLDANSSVGVPDEIVFDASLNGGTISIDSQLPTITDELTITGPGANLLSIDAQLGGDGLANGNGWRIFNVDDGTSSLIDVEISGLTLTGGDESGSGGAIFTRENLTLTSSTLTGNRAFHGGGIYNASGTTHVVNSTLSGNTGGSRGGGIYSKAATNLSSSTLAENHSTYGGGIYNASSGTLSVTNSTLSGNFAGNGGGGLDNHGTTNLSHSTVANNGTYLFGAGIRGYGTTTLDHTIVSGNEVNGSPSNLYSGVFSGDYNLVGIDSTITGSGNIFSDTPGLGPLASNGGSTQTHALLTGSPAIDAGGTTALANDQRGAPYLRVFGSAVDIGAFEATPLVVNDTSDIDDGDMYNGTTSLREAINQANAISGAETIFFAAELAGETIVLGSGELEITDSLAIDATPLVSNVTIDAQHSSRVLNFSISTGDLTLAGLTLQNGKTTGDNQPSEDDTYNGGGIRFLSEGTLTLASSILSGNSTTGSFAAGGGIFSRNGGVEVNSSTLSGNTTNGGGANGGGIHARFGAVTLIGSTISGNTTTSSGTGGGIYSRFGDVTLIQSTLSGNSSAGTFGGGISAAFGDVTIIGSTLSGNSAPNGGGIFRSNTGVGSNTPTLIRNSIVAGNTVAVGGLGPDLLANPNGILTVEYSLIGDTSNSMIDGTTGMGNLLDVDPLLGPLADNGGLTRTHALLPGSPALDAGNTILTSDQRGLAVPVDLASIPNAAGGNGSDIGAYEAQTAPSADFVDDDIISGLDFLAWQIGFGITSGAVRADGDSDGDGDVDTSDLAAWEATYGQVDTTPLVAALSAPLAAVASASPSSAGQLLNRGELVDLALTVNLAGDVTTQTAPLVEDPPVPTGDPSADTPARTVVPQQTSDSADEGPSATSSAEDDEAATPWLSDELLERVFG